MCPIYPLTCAPDDMMMAMNAMHRRYWFTDVHVRGRYPQHLLNYFARRGFTLDITEADRRYGLKAKPEAVAKRKGRGLGQPDGRRAQQIEDEKQARDARKASLAQHVGKRPQLVHRDPFSQTPNHIRSVLSHNRQLGTFLLCRQKGTVPKCRAGPFSGSAAD